VLHIYIYDISRLRVNHISDQCCSVSYEAPHNTNYFFTTWFFFITAMKFLGRYADEFTQNSIISVPHLPVAMLPYYIQMSNTVREDTVHIYLLSQFRRTAHYSTVETRQWKGTDLNIRA